MANIKSALKRIRSSGQKQLRNQPIRARARSAAKEARLAIESGNPAEAEQAIRAAFSALDRAAAKGVIHKRNAARRKSRLVKTLAKTSQG